MTTGARGESRAPTISYRDRELPVLEGVAVNSYVSDGFSVNDRAGLTYEQDGKQAAIGIDVSAYQGEIDWQQVADSGVEFAMIRLGYRGYSQGSSCRTRILSRTSGGRLDAGRGGGGLFFLPGRQRLGGGGGGAVRPGRHSGVRCDLPWPLTGSSLPGTPARTDGMEPEPSHAAPGPSAGYESGGGRTTRSVYFNQDLGYLSYQLDRLTDYTFWLAEYNARPSFFYHFDLWQYTHTASVPGIEGNVDMNLAFREFDEKPQHGEE